MTSEQDKVPDWAMKAAMVVKGFAPTMEIDRYFSPKTCKEVRRCARIIASHAPLDECVKAFGDIFNYAHKPEFVRKTAEDMITKLRGAR